MFKKLGVGIAGCFLFIACTNPDLQTANQSSSTVHATTNDTIVITHQPLLQEGCYQMTFKKDTAWLHLHIQDSIATGHLKYHWYMKDGNNGQIRGVIRDSIIYADYTFQSEGMTSVREVQFKVQNNALWQAIGKVGLVNNKVIYTDKNHLTYDSTRPFVKVPCTSEF